MKELRGVASACSLAFAARSDRSSTDEARARHHQYRLGCEIHSRFTMEREQPMTLEELMQCANVTRAAGWPGMQADGAPIMFTYATSLKLASTLPGAASLPHSHKWLLGLSAAQHRMPLVVGGWGQKPWNWYGGSSVKIYAGRRLAQLLDYLDPRARVIVADSQDAVLTANPAGSVIEQTLAAVSGGRPAVLAAAECSSWPKCYTSMYEQYAMGHANCVAKGLACFANGGGFLASSPLALRQLYERQIQLVQRFQHCSQRNCDSFMGRQVGLTERSRDQSVLTFLYVNRSRQGPMPFELALDSESAIFVNLKACYGRNPMASRGPMVSCYANRYAGPARWLSVDKSSAGVLLAPKGRATQRPLIVHANGEEKDRLVHPNVLPLTNASFMWSPSEEMLAHPVLLLDERWSALPSASAMGRTQPCRMTTVAELTLAHAKKATNSKHG